VKFEYISTKYFIEAIEDRDGEGVYFCTLCKKLFWNEKNHEKEHEKNLLMGNCKFLIE